MERPILTAEIREGVGKEKAKKLRSKGLIPAIFYGPRSQTIPLVIDSKELAKVLQTEKTPRYTGCRPGNGPLRRRRR